MLSSSFLSQTHIQGHTSLYKIIASKLFWNKVIQKACKTSQVLFMGYITNFKTETNYLLTILFIKLISDRSIEFLRISDRNNFIKTSKRENISQKVHMQASKWRLKSYCQTLCHKTFNLHACKFWNDKRGDINIL